MHALQSYLPVIGRILLAIIFVMSGLSKIADPAANAGYMEAFGLPAILLWPAIIVEVVGGILLIVGFQARLAAAALAVFTILAAVIFHSDFSVQAEMINFMKNLSITGGLLYVIAHGAGALSVDGRKR